MGYIPVDPKDLDGFPHKLGLTDVDNAPPIEISFTEMGGGAYKFDVEGVAFTEDVYTSKGLKEGAFPCGTSTLVDGIWSSSHMAVFSGRQSKWVGDLFPAERVQYNIKYLVTAEIAAHILACETEHVRDIQRAWDCSYGYLQALAKFINTPPVPAAESLQAFINYVMGCMQEVQADYLIPASPSEPTAWSQRVKSVFVELADQSSERDKKKEHSPAGYDLKVNSDKSIITIRMRPGPLMANSEAYIRPDLVQNAWDGQFLASADAVEDQADPSSLLGALVKCESPESLDIDECRYYKNPGDGAGIDDPPYVKQWLGAGVGNVHSIAEGGYLWVDIGPTEMYENASYVKVHASKLTPVNLRLSQTLENFGSSGSWSDSEFPQ